MALLRTRPLPTVQTPPPSLEADDALLLAASRTDYQVFRLLLERYAAPVYGYCFLLLGERERAQAATSAVFLHALADLRGRHERAVAAWLLGLARHACQGQHPDGAASELRAAFDALPPEPRLPLELQLAGWTRAQAAAALHATPEQADDHLARALRRLRDQLAGTPSSGHARLLQRHDAEAVLLRRCWDDLRHDPELEPPAGLAPDLARLVVALEQELRPPPPSRAFVADLWARLVRAATHAPRSRWQVPAWQPERPIVALPRVDASGQVLVAAPVEDVQFPPRRLARELLQMTEWAVAVAVISSLLVVALRAQRAVDVPPAPPTPVTTAVPVLPPLGLTLDTTIPVSTGGGLRLAEGAGALWAVSPRDGTLIRLDAVTGAVLDVIPVGAPSGPDEVPNVSAVAVGLGFVWVVKTVERRLLQLDPATNTVVAEVRVSGDPTFVAVGGGAIWVACPAFGKVERVDPVTHARRQVYTGDPAGPIAAGESGIWVVSEGALLRINPATYRVDRAVPLAASVRGVAVDDAGAWLRVPPGLLHAELTSAALSPLLATETGPTYGIGGGGVLLAGGVLWTTSGLTSGGELLAIDPFTRAVVARLPLRAPAGVSEHPNGFVVAGDTIWVATEDGAVVRVAVSREPFCVTAPAAQAYLDVPACQ